MPATVEVRLLSPWLVPGRSDDMHSAKQLARHKLCSADSEALRQHPLQNPKRLNSKTLNPQTLSNPQNPKPLSP